MKLRMLRYTALLCSFLLITACSSGSSGGGIPTGIYQLTVFEDDGSTPVADARADVLDANNIAVATLSTDASGVASFLLPVGVYAVRVQAQGFNMSPPQGVTAPPFTVVAAATVGFSVTLTSIPNPDGVALIRGNADVAGTLVVAEDSVQGIAVSGISDSAGNYMLFNVLPGNYVVTSYKAGYLSNGVVQGVAAGDDITVDLDVAAHASPSISGQLTFLAVTNGVVDVTLVHPQTRDAIPGLRTQNNGTNYTLANVPAGNYLAWATFANDGYVMDPDWIDKNGGFPAALEITMADVALTKDFSITGAVQLTSPTNPAHQVFPATINTTTPTFTWAAYASAQKYVLEVLDLNGNRLWGGYTFDANTQLSTFNHPDIDTPEPTAYNFDNSASQALVDGGIYQWRVHAFKWNTQRGGYVAIASSEQQRGLFKVELPAP